MSNPAYDEYVQGGDAARYATVGDGNAYDQPLPEDRVNRATYGVATAFAGNRAGTGTALLRPTYAKLPATASQRPVHLQLANHAHGATPVVSNPAYDEYDQGGDAARYATVGDGNAYDQPLPEDRVNRATYGVATAFAGNSAGTALPRSTYAELPATASQRPVHLQLADHAYGSDADRIGAHRVEQWLGSARATWESTENALLTGGALPGNYCLRREHGLIVLVILLQNRRTIVHFRLMTNPQGLLFVGDTGLTAPQSFATIHSLLGWFAKHPLNPRAPLLTGCVAPPEGIHDRHHPRIPAAGGGFYSEVDVGAADDSGPRNRQHSLRPVSDVTYATVDHDVSPGSDGQGNSDSPGQTDA